MKSFNHMFVILSGILKDGCSDDLSPTQKNNMKDDLHPNPSRHEQLSFFYSSLIGALLLVLRSVHDINVCKNSNVCKRDHICDPNILINALFMPKSGKREANASCVWQRVSKMAHYILKYMQYLKSTENNLIMIA